MPESKDGKTYALYTLALAILLNAATVSWYMGGLSERVANLTVAFEKLASKESVLAISNRVDRNTNRIDKYHGP